MKLFSNKLRSMIPGYEGDYEFQATNAGEAATKPDVSFGDFDAEGECNAGANGVVMEGSKKPTVGAPEDPEICMSSRNKASLNLGVSNAKTQEGCQGKDKSDNEPEAKNRGTGMATRGMKQTAIGFNGEMLMPPPERPSRPPPKKVTRRNSSSDRKKLPVAKVFK